MSRGLHTEEEKAKIRASKQATALRHSSMDVKVYELKIVEKRLNKQQKETFPHLLLHALRHMGGFHVGTFIHSKVG